MSARKKNRKEQEVQARRRVEMVIQVLSGQKTASEAAKQLGVSRKTYYKWEKRFLSATLEAVSEKEAGRPAKEVDKEKEQLQRQVNELAKQVQILKQTVQIRDLLQPKSLSREGRAPKKRRGKRRRLKQADLDLEQEGCDGTEKTSENGFGATQKAPDPGEPPGATDPSMTEDPRRVFDEKSRGKKSGKDDRG